MCPRYMHRTRTLLLLALLLGLGALFVQDSTPQERLEAAATLLQRQVDGVSEELNAKVNAALEAGRMDMGEAHAEGEGGGRFFNGRRVTAWNDHAPIGDAALDSSRSAHLVLPDGVYLHAFAIQGGRSVHALRRVWFKPAFENQYLHPHFDSGFVPREDLQAALGPGMGPVVHDANGAVMFRLQWAGDTVPPGTGSLVSLLLACLAILCAGAALWRAGMSFPGVQAPLLLFLPALLVVRIATLAHGSFKALATYPLFDPSLFASSFFMPSLGDLLINSILLLCAALYTHQVLRRRTAPLPLALLVGTVVLLFAAASGIGQVTIALVHDSSVSLDLFRPQDFNGYSLAALVAIGLLLAAWCILADGFARLFLSAMTGFRMLLLAVMAAIGLALANHATGNYDLVLAVWPVPVLVLLHRLRRRPSTITALLLVAVLALFTAHVLNRQTLKRQALDRDTLAEAATTREDPVVELLFDEAAHELRRDQPLVRWVNGRYPCTAVNLDQLVRQPYFTGYWDRFYIRIHLLSSGGYCTTSPDAPATAQAIADRFEQGVPLSAHEDLRLTDRPGENALYIGRVQLNGAELYVEVRPRLVTDGLGFPELLLAMERPAAFKPGRFVRARYERGVLTSSTGNFAFPINWHGSVPPGGREWVQDGYDLLARGDPHGMLVVLGSRVPTWLDHVTTFSYLFLFFCLIGALLAGVELAFAGNRPRNMGVRGKVRIGVAGFSIISLLLFTLGMRQMLEARREQRSSRTLDEQSRGVLAQLRQTLGGEGPLDPGMVVYLDHLLGNLSNVFFTDLTLYAPNGVVLATSREQVFNTGLLGRRMDPRAYQRIAVEGASSFINSEHIGTAAFSTAYMPFRNDQGAVLAYLALPYFARQGEVEQERAAGYVALVNLFALLFLLSVVAAALITQWTTRPLELLLRGIERIGIGTRNEPISYQGNDELGHLVQAYNRKVEELRESAERLARSERESAWKEMARQVAHEIKNPLTPMRLNVQHFQQTWDPAAPGAKERLDRFGNNLVEQIDVLSHIADEFTHFAQMPRARSVNLELGEMAGRAVALFAQQPGTAVELEGEGLLLVHIDPNHLLRILTNLIKNAIQAIPPERMGRVKVVFSQAGSDAVLEVRDNGSGIGEELRERIFTPNFTTKGSGMGLGLAMVQRMVESAGGKVWFTSVEGEGTSFFVALPLMGTGYG